MKVSIIHNVYQKNPYINDSIQYNIIALETANLDYQYIIFNDKGDKEIYDDVKNLVNEKVIYHYSDKNFGQGKCSGGWVGAIPLIKGDIIHNTGQDDVFTRDFYIKAKEAFLQSDIGFFSCNGIKTDEQLNQKEILINPNYYPDFSNPIERFKEWFGVVENQVTRANNGLLAPGTLYRKKLHDIISPPSVDDFLGTCDFEYWARMLFYGIKGKYEATPLWLYRVSDISLSNQVRKNNTDHRPPYLEKIKLKYKKLWEEKM